MTSSIQFSGVSSGLDTSSIIDALMTAEQAPLTRLTARQTDLTSRRDAVLEVRTKFADLLAKLRAFTETKTGSTMAATSSNPAGYTATAGLAAITAAHTVKVDHLATATVARSTASIGTAVTDGSQALATLPLRGSVTAGTIGMVVDGTVLQVTVGDPSTMTLDQLGTAIADAMTAQAAGTDTGATFTYSIVDNRIQFALSGGSSSHTVAFGVAGDTSNALGIVGLSTSSATVSAGGTITGNSLLGVVQATRQLATEFAGLSGQSGTLTINGVAIAWDAATDTVSGVLSRINASSAGVVASIDRTNDRIVLTNKTAGATALDIRDTGGLAAALNLGPGTTSAQTLGTNALVTVDGTQYVSASNAVTNAIDGVTLNLVAETATAGTLFVASDKSAITTALQDLVTSYNTVLDTVDKYSANVPGSATRGVLATDTTVSGLVSFMRSAMFKATGATSYNHLAAIGITTGSIGSKGTTGRLSLDTTRLTAALDANPAAVADLLGSATGTLKPIADRINTYAGIGGVFFKETQGMADQLASFTKEKARLQERIDARRATLEARYAAMETTLSSLQATLSHLNAQSNANTNNNG